MLLISKLTFEDIMNFCPKHNRSIYDNIVAAQTDGNVIPFIGAGLSAFCGYKLWGGVLSELADFIPDEEAKAAALSEIQAYEYEKAAQTILDAYPPMIDQLPGIVSHEKILTYPKDLLHTSAAFVLPYLFTKGLVITTNFDRVIETVYLERFGQPIEVVRPKEQDFLAQLRQNQALGLFKLHGDIGSSTVTIDDLVFTGAQYEKHYAENSPLVTELTRWFENRRLLFVGSSLNVDRTMEVLKRVALSQSGIRHYAIVGCKKSEITKRLKELSALGILPIIYDNSDHNAIRVILERLLEDTSPDSYKELQELTGIIPVVNKEEHRLSFDSEYFKFTGRIQELHQLEEFCSAEQKVLWWAVTGPGGMGKSRLVYEYIKNKKNDGWAVVRFEANPTRGSSARGLYELSGWFPKADKTIVVLDDVQAYMESVCDWLTKVERIPRSEKLRILMIEREGNNYESATWLDDYFCHSDLEEWLYSPCFLNLCPLSDPQLMEIMDNYADAAGKRINSGLLIKTLEKVDPGLKRPMYAIAIADARCQGKDPTNWSRKEILDTLLNREMRFHYDRLLGLDNRKTKLSKTLKAELLDLLAISCINNMIFVDQIPLDRYKTLKKLMDAVNMAPVEFFDRIGLLRPVRLQKIAVDESGHPVKILPETKSTYVISLSCPDLLKEHLVLKQVLEKGKLGFLFPKDWEKNPIQLIFLRNIFADYQDRMNEHRFIFETFLQAVPEKGVCSKIYGHVLWGITLNYPKWAKQAVNRSEQLWRENSQDSEIATFFSNGLVTYLYKDRNVDCKNTIDRLKELYNRFATNDSIASSYARGLCFLTSLNDDKLGKNAIDELEDLYSSHPNCQDIVTCLVDGIHNVVRNKGVQEHVVAIERLAVIQRDNPSSIDVVLRLMSRLGNLLRIQNPKDCNDTIGRINRIYNGYAGIEQVQKTYAATLLTKSSVQLSESEIQETLSSLRKIMNDYPDDKDLQLFYALTMCNLAFIHTSDKRRRSLENLRRFLREHSLTSADFQSVLRELANFYRYSTPEFQDLIMVV